MTVMDLRPREHGFFVDDMQKVNSAYTKKNPLAFVQKSDVVYMDKKEPSRFFAQLGLQYRPSGFCRMAILVVYPIKAVLSTFKVCHFLPL